MSWAGKMRRRLPARLRKAIGGGAGMRGGEFQLLGDRARDRGEWVEAGVHYRAFLDLNPEAFPIWVQLGHVSKEAGNPTGAEQAYLRALDLRPSDADLLLNLGHLMKAIGRPDAAADFYFRSAATDTTGNAERELLAIFERNGIAKLAPEGQPFNHDLHQAIFEVEDANKPAGTVVQVLQSGYTLKDRLLRPAMVGVSKGGVAAAGNAAAQGAGAYGGSAGDLHTIDTKA